MWTKFSFSELNIIATLLKSLLLRLVFENSSFEVGPREWKALNKVQRLGDDEGKEFV
jgi:hypothetical protein